jgi:hypothetical protein
MKALNWVKINIGYGEFPTRGRQLKGAYMYLSPNEAAGFTDRGANARDLGLNSKYSADRFEEYDHKHMLDCRGALPGFVIRPDRARAEDDLEGFNEWLVDVSWRGNHISLSVSRNCHSCCFQIILAVFLPRGGRKPRCNALDWSEAKSDAAEINSASVGSLPLTGRTPRSPWWHRRRSLLHRGWRCAREGASAPPSVWPGTSPAARWRRSAARPQPPARP